MKKGKTEVHQMEMIFFELSVKQMHLLNKKSGQNIFLLQQDKIRIYNRPKRVLGKHYSNNFFNIFKI